MNIGIVIAVAGIPAVMLFAPLMHQRAAPAVSELDRGEDHTPPSDQRQAAEIVQALTTPCWQQSGCEHLFYVQ